jgi:uncharacterized protein
MPTTLQPLSEPERDRTLDILRGFALAGVLFVFCTADMAAPANYVESFRDELISWPRWILVENRMYGMLIIIFGFGFGVQVKKATEKNESVVPLFVRRLTGLLILGLLHALLLSTRDILIFYAVAGFALLPARNFSNRNLLLFIGAVSIILVTPILRTIFGSLSHGHAGFAEPNSFIEHLKFNWNDFKIYHLRYGIYVDALFHFLFGFYLQRIGFLEKLKENKPFRKRVFMISLIAAVIIGTAHYTWIEPIAWPAMFEMKESIQKFSANTGLKICWHSWIISCALLYSTILVAISLQSNFRRLLEPLSAFGQMALSNYLIQSLILVPYALGFDKFNDMPAFQGFVLFLGVFAFQLIFSSWWLKRYRMGPFEWVLRSFTYWRWQSQRSQPARSKVLSSN